MIISEINFFFKQLKLAGIQRKLFFSFRASTEIQQLLKPLQKLHLISGFLYKKNKKYITIFLRYDRNGFCVFQEIKTVSSIRQRVLISFQQIKLFKNDYPYSTPIIWTAQGFLSIQDCLERRIGGELIVYFK